MSTFIPQSVLLLLLSPLLLPTLLLPANIVVNGVPVTSARTPMNSLQGVKMPTFYFPNTNIVYGDDETNISTNSFTTTDGLNSFTANTADPVSVEQQRKIAIQHMMNQFSLDDEAKMLITDEYFDQSSGVLSVHCSPHVDNIPIVNAAASVNVNSAGRVISTSDAWKTPKLTRLQKRQNKVLPPADALKAFADLHGLDLDTSTLETTTDPENGDVKVSGAPFTDGHVIANDKYYQTEQGSLEKVVELEIPMKSPNLFEVYVSVATQEVLAITDLASNSLFDSPEMKSREENNDDLTFAEPLFESVVTKPARRLQKRQLVEETDLKLLAGLTSIGNPLAVFYKAASGTDLSDFGLGGPSFASFEGGNFEYQVVAIPNANPADGIERIVDPADKQSSPQGWHSEDSTVGNNVVAQLGSNDNRGGRPEAQDFKFDFDVDDKAEQPQQYQAASVTNMFYASNYFHDTMYRYGFNEAAGNFQRNNFGKGGRGGDAVVAFSQDGSGKNNANFASPPDGRSGRMRMFIFESVTNGRDGALDNGVVIHELTHGVSSRLTGGPNRASCLTSDIAGGLGEGWSDYVAMSFIAKAGSNRNSDVGIGAYVTNKKKGVRTFPYSTNPTRNPRKYSDLNTINNGDVHKVGEVWASMLFEVYWNFVDKLGFENNIQNSSSQRGNTVLLQTVLDGMRLQPCNPNFVQARDAIIQADRVRNGGRNACEIWKGFAKRGLGTGASGTTFTDNFGLPQGCN